MQFINHFQEALLPLVIKKGYNWLHENLMKKFPQYFGGEQINDEDDKSQHDDTNNVDSVWSPSALGLQCLEINDPRIENCRKESDMDPYEVRFRFALYRQTNYGLV